MDVEKTIQFIVEQQAQFSADIQVLKERDSVLSKQIQDLNQAQLRQLETVNRLVDVTSDMGKQISELATDQRETSRSLKALIQVVDGLARRS